MFGDDAEREPSPRHDGPADERIRDDVTVALLSDRGFDAGDIEVRVRDAEVTLVGTVADKFARRMAQDVAESVFGVTSVLNNLRIRRDGDGTEASSGRRGDREVLRRPEREGGMVAEPSTVPRRKPTPSSPETLAD